ncbi:MAG: amino acid adenylation domain-containing protein [Chloroflexota bacterium]
MQQQSGNSTPNPGKFDKNSFEKERLERERLVEDPSNLSSLVDLLRWRGQEHPDVLAYLFLEDGESEEYSITYGELDRQARLIAGQLQQMNLANQRALLLYPPGLEYIAAFWGCLYAGTIAVPTYPPRRNRHDPRLHAIAADSQAAVALTTGEIHASLQKRSDDLAKLGKIEWLIPSNIEGEMAESWVDQGHECDKLAFLQYTSGSTGDPKGVMVSHGNLLHNSQYIRQSCELVPSDISVTWLPSFHDMGLIDGVLQPVYAGMLGVMMPPVAFLQQPLRWLQAITKYGGTHSGGPNFGYELCMEKITPEQKAELDLSRWTSAYNGAEPIRAETLTRFSEAFAECGFHHQAHYPCYGMAEATLMLTGSELHKEPKISIALADEFTRKRVKLLNNVVPDNGNDEMPDAPGNPNETATTRQLVGCGSPVEEIPIAIVNPETLKRCAEGEIGEIWAAGKGIAHGYWNRPELSEETFNAFIADSSEGPWLRTGDLGALVNDELYVAGRLKDLIIIHGSNYYPQDIELTAEQSHLALRPGCGAAFSITHDGEEKLVIVQEVERTHARKVDIEEVGQTVRNAVLAEHGLLLYGLLLLKPTTIPKTSSGKIRRRASQSGYLNDTLKPIATWGPLPHPLLSGSETVLFEGAELEEAEPKTADNAESIIHGSEDAENETTGDPQLETVAEPQGEAQTETPMETERNDPAEEVSTTNANDMPSTAEIQDWLIIKVAEQVKLPSAKILITSSFVEFGLTSVTAVGLTGELENWLGCKLPPTLAYDYPNIRDLANHLTEHLTGKSTESSEETTISEAEDANGTQVGAIQAIAEPTSAPNPHMELTSESHGQETAANEAIAIVGLGCRFPQASSPDEFWQILVEGKDVTSVYSNSRWFGAAPNDEGMGLGSTKGGFLQSVDTFDPAFFNISGREAKYIDPQQRLLLEVAWESLEYAGIAPGKLNNSATGVFVGAELSDYSHLQFNGAAEVDGYSGTGGALSILANRLSYFLNLHGPSIMVDTACSSSLVAIHLACQSLRLAECDLALAGGVNIILNPTVSTALAQAGMIAPDGRCKTFSADADGYARGEGCGVVVLKRLDNAIRDGDLILATILGSAVNQDGRTNGLTAPSGSAQSDVVRKALANAHCAPDQVSYIETHGTGTPLGDPIEVNALKFALDGEAPSAAPCWMGSVKTNIGHLEAAAGIAGLIKVVLAFQNKMIPPHINLNGMNPHIKLDDSRLAIPTEPQAWVAIDAPRRAGVSSFGFGGTNAHLIVEEGLSQTEHKDERKEADQAGNAADVQERPRHLLTLSAKTEQALKELANQYVNHIDAHPAAPVADLCYTANTGRTHFGHRVAVTGKTLQQLRTELQHFLLHESRETSANQKHGVVAINAVPQLAFLFTGQGTQYLNMGRSLYESQPQVRQTLDQCNEILQPYLEQPLLSVLYPELEEAKPLSDPAYAQPATFALQVAVAQLWQSWGVTPAVLLGHSIGEFAAACVAGACSLEDGLTFIAKRGQLMNTLSNPGKMMAVMASPDEVATLLQKVGDEQTVAIAAMNGPNNTVISGDSEAMVAVMALCAEAQIETRRLYIDHAYHSPLMNPVLPQLAEIANTVRWRPLQLPIISSVTGDYLPIDHVYGQDYWVDQMHRPVQFTTALQRLVEMGINASVEMGPIPVLTNFAQQTFENHPAVHQDPFTFAYSLRKGREDWAVLLNGLASLYVAGVEIDWQGFDGIYRRNRQILPTYPFQRKRYWLEPATRNQSTTNEETDSSYLTQNQSATSQAMQSQPAQNQPSQNQPMPSQPLRDQPVRDPAIHQLTNGNRLKDVQAMGSRNILAELQTLAAKVLEIPLDEVNPQIPFLEMGADSLILMDTIRRIERTYGIQIAIRQVFDELTNLEKLAMYIKERLPRSSASQGQTTTNIEQKNMAVASSVVSAPVESNSAQSAQKLASHHQPTSAGPKPNGQNGTQNQSSQPVAPSAPPNQSQHNIQNISAVERLLSQQIDAMSHLMSEQLALLQGVTLEEASAAPVLSGHSDNGHPDNGYSGHQYNNQPTTDLPTTDLPTTDLPTTDLPTTDLPTTNLPTTDLPTTNLPTTNLPTTDSATAWLTPVQQEHLTDLIQRYTQRTEQSRALAQQNRPIMADSRASAGFRLSTKEMVYPIVGKQAAGSRMWDIDGNEYVDIAMGFGVHLFGHNPDFIQSALIEKAQQGFQLGPQNDLAGQVVRLICKLTGVERVTLTNSGTEAVMTALRMARTVTDRKKVVIFSGSYHGQFDGTLALADETGRSEPVAPGITPGTVEDLIVLDGYGNMETLETIRQHAHELAAVLVAPVQSRHPDVQPKAFLQALRQITQESGAALIFDEVITGFRLHPGGAQAWFDVQADIVTYGKIIGGGLPIGIIGGQAAFMDAIDGGQWRYGDDSYPTATTTFFAGTFCKHPLTMVTALATLRHLEQQGPALQEELTLRTARFVDRMNRFFVENEVPIHVEQCASLFYFTFKGNLDLFFYHLLENGVYVWEGRTCFLSTAHTEQDIDLIVEAIEKSVVQMRQGGFLPPLSQSAIANKLIVQSPSTLPIGRNGEKLLSNGINGTSNSASHNVAKYNDLGSTDSGPTDLGSTDPGPTDLGSTDPGPITVPTCEAQKQLWALTQMDPEGSLAYQLSYCVALEGDLDVALLKQASEILVSRHEALRTTISADGLHQVIAADVPVAIGMTDFVETGICKLSQEVQADRRKQWLKRLAHRAFDLTNGPLLAIDLLRADENYYYLNVAAHHTVVDGWSILRMMGELATIYSNVVEQQPLELAPATQYQELVHWQQTQQDSPEMAAHESYWLSKFEQGVPVLELPTDRPRPSLKTYRAGQKLHRLDSTLTSALRKFSGTHKATLFMTLLSAFTGLLHRLTRAHKVAVGIPVGGRPDETMNDVIGYCAHEIIIDSSLTDGLTFADYLTQQRNVVLDSYEHQDYPFAWLLNKLNAPRDLSRSPLVSAVFNLDPQSSVPNFAGLQAEPLWPECQFVDNDIILDVVDLGEELVLNWRYNADLFNPDSMERWAGYFEAFLQRVVDQPNVPVKTIELLGVKEQSQQLVEWNSTERAYPLDIAFHRLFEKQAAQTPDQSALVCGSEQMTYAQLNERANGLAEQLIQEGVGKDQIVALFSERTMEFATAVLAIWKAGGAYLPLDPNHPVDRIRQIIEQSGTKLVLASDELVIRAAEAGDLLETAPTVWNIESTLSTCQPSADLPLDGSPDALAYVIFTSGSTGKPKGAMVEMKGMVNHLFAKVEELALTATDRVVQNASQCFDISIWQLWSGLLAGGTTYIYSDEVAHLPQRLIEHTAADQITVLEVVPSMLRAMLDDGGNDSPDSSTELPHLRWLLATGEALPPELSRSWLTRYPGIPMVNAYGPTECSDDVTHHFIHKVPDAETMITPIGQAIANTQLYVLDEQMQPVPLGVAGELYVGGAGVGRGYLNDPERTAQAFVGNPFSQDAQARLYKTGDLVRYATDGSDGTIEFLGRLDHQVKIRGYRIELGEIENVLLQHELIHEAAVVAHSTGQENTLPADNRLVAYLAPQAEFQMNGSQMDEVETVSTIRGYLREQLPEYMVPAAFVLLEQLPLTPNGKLDRKALPAPSEFERQVETEYVPAQTATEQHVATLWQKALNLTKVGIHDNFFDLGGHSLMAIQIHNELISHFGDELVSEPKHGGNDGATENNQRKFSVIDLFRYPTVHLLAQFLDKGQPNEQEAFVKAPSAEEHAEMRKAALMKNKNNKRRRIGRRSTKVVNG